MQNTHKYCPTFNKQTHTALFSSVLRSATVVLWATTEITITRADRVLHALKWVLNVRCFNSTAYLNLIWNQYDEYSDLLKSIWCGGKKPINSKNGREEFETQQKNVHSWRCLVRAPLTVSLIICDYDYFGFFWWSLRWFRRTRTFVHDHFYRF